MVDPTGYVLTIIRANPAVTALVGTRVRGGEPANGDALGPGSYQRFVVLSRLGAMREKRLPVQEVRLAARCYGLTYQDAAALAGAVSDAIHGLSPRVSAGNVGIWSAFDEGGEGASRDPDTDQPYEVVIITVNAADRLVT